MISTLWAELQQQTNINTHERIDLGAIHGVGAPIHVYPLYENGFRAHRGQSIKENHNESAKLYAQFEEVAAQNEYAWSFGKRVGEDGIKTVSGKNRMICFPCEHPDQFAIGADERSLTSCNPIDPLLMNAFNTVNLAAACILTSTEYAKELGIPESKWIYPLGGAGTKDSDECKSSNIYINVTQAALTHF